MCIQTKMKEGVGTSQPFLHQKFNVITISLREITTEPKHDNVQYIKYQDVYYFTQLFRTYSNRYSLKLLISRIQIECQNIIGSIMNM